ncbi:MAG: hypothetical protein HYW50_00285 [Candidatus Diapherotrites archaeon]|nr:hypothetical protein [Candidatus Diapherotrites archaeon]
MKKTFFFLFLVLLFFPSALAVIQNSQLKVLAVTSDGKGLGADLFLEIEEGSGGIWVSAEPLVGTTTQSAARTARDVAKKFSLEVEKHDFKFSIDSAASLVEGPSAGAAMALLIVSSLQNKVLPSNISVTGTIDGSGNVGPVGGVFEKSVEASKLGIELFMIPRGEAVQTVRIEGQVKSINLVEYGPNDLGMTIVEVANIDDVIKYAFSDIKSIDVSQIIASSEIPDFVPKPVLLQPHLQVMKSLVNEYIRETNVIIGEAKNSVSFAVIEDPALVNTLLDTITSAEQTMRQAEILDEQNYLYSAANFAFLARVNALLVRDVSLTPSILNPSSSALEYKISELKSGAIDLEEMLDKSIPVDYLEWYISAQQRLSYAKVNLDKLSSTQVIIIGGDSISDGFERLSDYEFAVAWLGVAEDFFEITKNSVKRVKLNSAFENEMDDLLVKGEETAMSLPEETADDIVRRINAAKFEKAKGWNMASVFDSATAYALGSAEKLTEGKEITELTAVLESKINDFEKKISSSKYKFSWPVLYLDHAKYFLESANYYSSSNQTARAVNSLRSGISLIILADQLVLVAEPIFGHYENVSANELVSDSFPAATPASMPFFNPVTWFSFPANSVLVAGFFGAVLLFAAILGFFIYKTVSKNANKSPQVVLELIKIKDLQRKADSALLEGKISEQKHSELVLNYCLEQALLEKQHAEQVSRLLEIDKERADLVSLEKRLRDLKSHLKERIISEEDFKLAKKELVGNLNQIKEDLLTEEKSVQKVMEKSKSTLDKIRQREKNLTPIKAEELPAKTKPENEKIKPKKYVVKKISASLKKVKKEKAQVGEKIQVPSSKPIFSLILSHHLQVSWGQGFFKSSSAVAKIFRAFCGFTVTFKSVEPNRNFPSFICSGK